MKDWKAVEKELRSGANADALRALASTGEARALEEQFSPGELESAVRSGDTARMAQLLRRALSTPEGAALAEKLRDLSGK